MKRKKTIAFAFYLPNECWESVIEFLNVVVDDDGNNHRNLEPLSLFSKQFLSITNRLIYSLTVCDQAHPPFRHLFHRFTNLASLNLSRYNGHDLNKLLSEISRFPLNITSLNLSNQPNIPTNGLQAFSRNIATFISLTCSRISTLCSFMFLITDCFPLLEELDLSNPSIFMDQNNFLTGIETLSLSLLKLRKVNLSNHDYMNDQSLLNLFKNWKLLEEAIIFDCHKITNTGCASALRERPILRSLSFTCYVWNYNYLMNFVVSPQVRSIHLHCNTLLIDESIIMFASIFSNLELLDLEYCKKISEEGICDFLRRCPNIKHLNLTHCRRVKLHRMNFEANKLEVLDLSITTVDDEALYVISKSCHRLLKLSLEYCSYVTEKGVRNVLENCTQLREINLGGCSCADIVFLMVILRPSLVKIIAPPRFRFTERKRKLFIGHGCLVC